jgi:hypothetical protein
VTANKRLAKLVTATSAALGSLAEDAVTGAIDVATFGDRFAEQLVTAHAAAVVIGRNHAGDDAPPEADDRAFAETVVDDQAEYLSRFMQALRSDVYVTEEGEPMVARVRWRAGLYARRLLGTANEAWGLTLPEGRLFYWHLGEEVSHCRECPEIQAFSPFTIDTIPTWPGQASTQCGTHCRCHVTTLHDGACLRLPE